MQVRVAAACRSTGFGTSAACSIFASSEDDGSCAAGDEGGCAAGDEGCDVNGTGAEATGGCGAADASDCGAAGTDGCGCGAAAVCAGGAGCAAEGVFSCAADGAAAGTELSVEAAAAVSCGSSPIFFHPLLSGVNCVYCMPRRDSSSATWSFVRAGAGSRKRTRPSANRATALLISDVAAIHFGVTYLTGSGASWFTRAGR